MIVKGGSVGGGGLAAHLKSDENERVDLVSVDGLLSTDIAGAIREMRALASGLTAKGLFHFQISPGLGEKWGPTEEARAVALLVEEYGLQGQPMKVVRHAKDAQGVGRDDHLHVVALRTRENGKVISDGFSRVRNEKVSRVLEYELGHRLIPGRHNKAVLARLRAEGRTDVVEWMQQATQVARPEAAKTFAEHQKEKRTGIKKADVATATLAAWRASDCGTAFAAAMEAQGLRIARGREGGIMVVDAAGGAHELTRLLRAALKTEGEKRSAADIRAEIVARTADLDVNALPTVAEASALAREGVGDSAERPAAPVGEPEVGVVVMPESVLATITTEKSTFTETDLDKALKGLGADKLARAAIKAAILDRRDVLTLAVDQDGERRMTTLEMAVVEARLLDTAEAMAARSDLRVDGTKVEAGLAAYAASFRSETGHDLLPDQAGGIRHITGGGDFVRIEGVAGAGKSTLLSGAARIWATDELRVEGCALSGIAASKIAESGIPSDTIAAKLLRWDRIDAIRDLRQSGVFTDESRGHVLRALDGWVEAATKRGDDTAPIQVMRSQVEDANTLKDLDRKTRMWLGRWSKRQIAQGLDARTVLVIDECGMVNHRLLDRVMAHAHRAGAKVVAVGDSEQIQPIEAGAAFRVLEKVAPAYRLDTVVRQSEAWMRKATSDLASAVSERAIQAVQAYAEHGHVHAGIRGVGDLPVIITEAAEKLGRDLTAADRRHIEAVAIYMDARGEAGGLWREIDAAKGRVEDHPLYGDFKAAKERRNGAAKALAADLDGARPWLARYGADARGFAADVAYAEGTHRVLAEELADQRAEAMGLTDLVPDVRLSLDLRGAARQALFADWRASVERDGPEVSRLILCYTRADRDHLNGDARAAWREMGHLSGPDISIKTEIDGEAGTMMVAVGDRIMTLANDKGVGVQNGTTGRVVNIATEPGKEPIITMATDDGRTVTIDTATYRALAHGYAATLHKSQGVTVSRAWLLHHRLIDRHLAYVALSRHKSDVRVYAAASDAPTIDALARQIAKGRTKDAISDYVGDARTLLRDPTAVQMPIRQAIGAVATTVRDFGQRLRSGLAAPFRTTTQELSHVHARSLRDQAAPRQLGPRQFGPDLAPARPDRLPVLSLGRVVDGTDRHLLLLPHDALYDAHAQRRDGDRDLRRAGPAGLSPTPDTDSHSAATPILATKAITAGDPKMVDVKPIADAKEKANAALAAIASAHPDQQPKAVAMAIAELGGLPRAVADEVLRPTDYIGLIPEVDAYRVEYQAEREDLWMAHQALDAYAEHRTAAAGEWAVDAVSELDDQQMSDVLGEYPKDVVEEVTRLSQPEQSHADHNRPAITYPAFDAAIQEYRELSSVLARSDDQEDLRGALADAVRSICRSESNLRQLVPRHEADEIMTLASLRDEAYQAELAQEAGAQEGVPADEAKGDTKDKADRRSAHVGPSIFGRKNPYEQPGTINPRHAPQERASIAGVAAPKLKTDQSASSTKAFAAAATAFATLPKGASERAAAADALRGMARTSDTLGQKLGKEQAEEVLHVARQRDEQQVAERSMAPAGEVPARTTFENAEGWREVMDAHPRIIKSVAEYGSHVDVHLTDGTTVRDTGMRLTADAITPKVAEAMALGAVEKGWTEVNLTGSKEEKETMAKAMVARGIKVSNPEMGRFINGPECERARALGAEREALDLARQQPDLADPQLFQQAERDYQRALVGGSTPDDQLQAMKADVMARGEAVKEAGYSGGETWAQQAEHVDSVQAVAEHSAKA